MRGRVITAAVAGSVILHAVALCWWRAGPVSYIKPPGRAELRVGFRAPLLPPPSTRATAAVPAGALEPPGIAAARTVKHPVQGAAALASLPAAPAVPAVVPGPDAQAIIAAARVIIRDSAREGESAAGRSRAGLSSAGAAETAWARHTRQAPARPVEKLLADGSRLIRYPNGGCLRESLVPGAGQINALGERLPVLMTNCP